MKQYANLRGFRSAMSALARNRSQLVPHLHAKDITKIRFSGLRNAGFKAVVFDKDNTLTAPYKLDIFNEEIAAAVRESQKQFGSHSVLIFSNTAGTTEDPGYALATKLEKSLGISVFRHREQKPGGGQEMIEYFAAQKIQPHEIIVVGDRYTTDVLFGNLHGMLTIKTRILTPIGENFVVRFVRRRLRSLEENWIPRSGVSPPAHPLLPSTTIAQQQYVIHDN